MSFSFERETPLSKRDRKLTVSGPEYTINIG